jgi:hypothetical protein
MAMAEWFWDMVSLSWWRPGAGRGEVVPAPEGAAAEPIALSVPRFHFVVYQSVSQQ